jgi:hypothetical protein
VFDIGIGIAQINSTNSGALLSLPLWSFLPLLKLLSAGAAASAFTSAFVFVFVSASVFAVAPALSSLSSAVAALFPTCVCA